METNKKQLRHIAIAGNIGAGKTTLTTQLGQHFGWHIFYEDVDHNPYLDDFYEDMKRWSFNLQIYFLNSRFAQVKQIQQGDRTVIQDRTIYEDANIFAPNLYEMGLMTPRDFENYTTLFKSISSLLDPPDLLIYLRASIPTLLQQIRRRGRNFESNIRPDYLENLNNYYETWINNYEAGKLLILDIDNLNYADNPADLQKVIELVAAELSDFHR
ncbi:MAG: deoxynucleoside kinase [Chitinophagales bacterium]|nr:deoxynucleoside kinase [Chitinophagales bacterium]